MVVAADQERNLDRRREYRPQTRYTHDQRRERKPKVMNASQLWARAGPTRAGQNASAAVQVIATDQRRADIADVHLSDGWYGASWHSGHDRGAFVPRCAVPS
jgi:hypothetical protein